MPEFLPEDPNAETRNFIRKAMSLRGLPEQFILLFHADAVVHIMGSRQDQHFYGTHRGHAQILQVMRSIDVVVNFMLGSVVRMRQGRIAEVFEFVDTTAVQLFDGDYE